MARGVRGPKNRTVRNAVQAFSDLEGGGREKMAKSFQRKRRRGRKRGAISGPGKERDDCGLLRPRPLKESGRLLR